MLVYVDGPDQSGKSTFMESWLKAYPEWLGLRWVYPDLPSGVNHTDFFLGGNWYTTGFHRDVGRRPFTNVMAYRCFLSEYAYAPLYDRTVPDAYVEWWGRAQSPDTVVLLFGISHRDYLQRASSHPDRVLLSNEEHWNAVTRRYLIAAGLSGVRWMFVDGAQPFADQAASVQARLRSWKPVSP